MARARGHLRVVPTDHDQRTAMAAAIKQVAARVPTLTGYHWKSDEAVALFEAIHPYIADGTITMRWVQDTVDMPGLHYAYLEWLQGR